VRVAALYDVHGNLPALEAVLAEVEREDCDVVLVGGDVCAGPFPSECLALLRGLGERAIWIRGNAERSLHGWPAQQLSEDERAFVRAVQFSVVLDDVFYCHGSPRADDEMLTPRTPESRLEEALAGVSESIVVHGHTHIQYERRLGARHVIGPGSVGMPYGPASGAYWGWFGSAYEPQFTEYDLEGAAERIRASSWPGASEFADENVLRVPSAEEAMDVFEARG
jgi:putative phosphoesterase